MADAVPDARELEELAGKYARLLALREAHERARQGGAPEPDPRAEMEAIAARWPGALRELDELPLDDVRARLAAIEAARDGQAPVLPWMCAQLRFHAEARGALAAKRWLRGRRLVDETVRATFVATTEGDAEARGWAEDLERVARPPRGRLLDLVWPRVARALGVSEAEARDLVVGVRR